MNLETLAAAVERLEDQQAGILRQWQRIEAERGVERAQWDSIVANHGRFVTYQELSRDFVTVQQLQLIRDAWDSEHRALMDELRARSDRAAIVDDILNNIQKELTRLAVVQSQAQRNQEEITRLVDLVGSQRERLAKAEAGQMSIEKLALDNLAKIEELGYARDEHYRRIGDAERWRMLAENAVSGYDALNRYVRSGSLLYLLSKRLLFRVESTVAATAAQLQRQRQKLIHAFAEHLFVRLLVYFAGLLLGGGALAFIIEVINQVLGG